MRLIFRPIGNDWQGARTSWSEKQDSRFRSQGRWNGQEWTSGQAVPWSKTVDLLERELFYLGAGADPAVLQLDAQESDFRLDGEIKANARLATEGVILSIDSKYGPLRYQCDSFKTWKDNVRAIALALEALRKVDRYGVTKRGEQYSGWKALPAAGETMTAQEARVVLDAYGGEREALKATHPDLGGSRDAFDRVQRARLILGLRS